MPELIVHIGAGKTGSTAIQFSLRQNQEALQAQGVAYLGLMLEQVPGARRHDWCAEGAPQRFFASDDPDRTDDEVYEVLAAEMRRLDAAGITRAIWSNEAFLVQNKRVLRILRQLAGEEGVTIRPVAYVRRHDKRAASAYTEFGIKSKRHEGPVRSFSEWVGGHAVAYAGNLELWRAAFPALEIYNFDTAGDVAAHFCEATGLEGIEPVRANEAVPMPLLAAWAVFGNSRPRPTWALAFRRLAAPLKILADKTRPMPPLDQLMPSKADLEGVQETFRDDLEAVNAMLEAQGQPPMVFDTPEPKPAAVSPWETERLLWRAVFALQEQVLDLQAEVTALREGREPPVRRGGKGGKGKPPGGG